MYPFLMLKFLAVSVALLALSVPVTAHERIVPKAVQALVGKDSRLLDFAKADLNGDGTKDYVFILQRNDVATDDAHQRVLKIATADKAGKLTVVKANENAVFCEECDITDPFYEIRAGKGAFAIHFRAEAGSQYSDDYEFTYVPKAGSWRLAKVAIGDDTSQTFDEDSATSAPFKKEIHTPADFGDIDIADFNITADNYRD